MKNTIGIFPLLAMLLPSCVNAAGNTSLNFDKPWSTSSSTPAQQMTPPKRSAMDSAALTEEIVKSVVKHTYDTAFAEYYRQHPDEQQPDNFVYEVTPFQIRKFTFTDTGSRKIGLMYAVDTTITVRVQAGRALSDPTILAPEDGKVLFFYQDATGVWKFGQEFRSEIGKYVDLTSSSPTVAIPAASSQKASNTKQEQPRSQVPADSGKLYFQSQQMWGAYGGYMEYRWYAFGRDNVVYRGGVETDGSKMNFFARSSPDTFDVAGACQASPKSCGKLSGGTITWADGSSATSVEHKSNGLFISGIIVKPLRPFARGQRFDGNFTVLSVLTTSAVSASSSKTLRFNLDGTFSTKSVDVASVHPYQGDGINAGTSYGKSAGEGTYEVVGGTLILNYQGRQEKLPILDYGVNKDKTPMGKPEALIIGDCYYKRYE